MRVAVVAGPDPGHCVSGDRALSTVSGGRRHTDSADRRRMADDRARGRSGRGRTARGLDPTDEDDDLDAGAKIHQRAARMARAQRAAAAGDGAGSGGVRRHHDVRRHGGRAARHAVDRAEPASALPAVEGVAAAGQRVGARHRHPGPAARHHDAGADRAVVAGRSPAAPPPVPKSVCPQPIPARCGD